jgi:pyruvate/2-oxoglutarate dehydrogenase complex dihydrolipoamide dehydrogenase (E3) component
VIGHVDVDVVVVGGGTAGIAAALTARHRGASVVLVDREPRLGGDCTFYGCVPSKALVEMAKVVHEARRAAARGILDAVGAVNFEAVAALRDEVVAEIAADERDERFLEAGIELIRGEARFVGAHEIAVGETTLTADRFVVATGSEPVVLPIAGIDDVGALTNQTIFGLRVRPDRLVVIGGGATGLELAQAFRRLGSEVVVIEAAERLLAEEEPEVSDAVERFLRAEQIEIRLRGTVTSARREGEGVGVELEDETIVGDAILIAAGRRGATATLALERAGIELEDGYVGRDDRCRTTVDHIFAAGDVTGGLQFTHVAAHEGRVAGENAAGGRAKVDERVAPAVTFLDPEVARVGLTEEQARRDGDVGVLRFPMQSVDRARIAGGPTGFVKLIIRRRPLLGYAGGGRLVGATIVGPRAGELIHECALAMRTNAFAGRLAQTIHAYPSMSVAVQQAAAQMSSLGRMLVESDAAN